MIIRLGLKFFIYFFALCILTSVLYSQTPSSSDSLKNLIKSAKTDSLKIKYYYKLAALNEESNPDSSEYYYLKAVDIALSSSDDLLKIQTYHSLGLHYSNTSEYKKALEIYLTALKISEQLRKPQELAFSYMYIGELYMYQCDYPKALNLLQKAVTTLESLNKAKNKLEIKQGMVMCYNDIGSIHAENGNYKQSIAYFKKALVVEEEIGDKLVVAGCNNNIGNVYYMEGDYPRAIEYYTISLKMAEELKDKSSMSERYNNLGVVLTEMQEYSDAIVYYEKSYAIDQELGDQKGMSLVLGNIALLKIKLKSYNESIQIANKSLDIAKKIGSLDEEKCAYEYLSIAYDSLKNYEQTAKYLKLFKKFNDSIFNIESGRQVKEMEAVYQTEKNQKEIELLNKDKKLQQIEISKQEMQKWGFIIGFALMLVLSVVVYRSYSQKKKANLLLTQQKKLIEEKNEELNQQNEEISAQRDEIESQRDLVYSQKEHIEEIHKKVTDSINYAKKIQEAVLPTRESTHALLGDHFIIYKPKDIVSGDFFWTTQVGPWLVIAVADCTGHGVPGGFMSMLGISYLNEIVRKKEVTQANHVLNHLREEIIEALRQTGTAGEQKDGMDISLCVINTETMECQWAGANNPLYIIKAKVNAEAEHSTSTLIELKGDLSAESSTLVELKGDKMPISIHRNMANFTNHVFGLEKGDMLYLTTDGFCDQFGGPHDRKFLSKNFKNLLIKAGSFPMEKQKELLNEVITSWMNHQGKIFEQTDDITVVGIKI